MLFLWFLVICCICFSKCSAKASEQIADGVKSTHDYIQKLAAVDDLCDVLLEDLIEINTLRPQLFMENLHMNKDMENAKKIDNTIATFTSDFILFNNLLVEMVLPSKKLLIELMVKAYDFLEKTK